MPAAYNRTNAIPNQAIGLRTQFTRYGAPFDPYNWGPVKITKRHPSDPLFTPADILEEIPKAGISHLSVGLFEYITANTTINAVGTYYDVFSFQFELNGPVYQVVNTFNVTATGLPKVGYITVAELREEGLTDAVKYPDAFLNRRIAYNSKLIDMYTGRFFEPRKMFIDIDGPGSYEIQMDIPIISVDSVTLLDREFPVTKIFTFDLEDLVIYNRHITMGLFDPDDRDDPRLGNVYFPRGRMNVRIEGTFGYTDRAGNTPEEIKRACMLMVLSDKEPLASPDRTNSLTGGIAGPLLEEDTDGHRYKIAVANREMGATAYFTGNPEVDQILLSHRRPFDLGKNLGANVSTSLDHATEFDRFRSGYDFYFGRSM